MRLWLAEGEYEGPLVDGDVEGDAELGAPVNGADGDDDEGGLDMVVG
jgi:hypothetical protein